VHDQGLLDQAKMDLARFQTLVKQNSIARQQAEDQVFIVKQNEGSVKLDQAQIDNQKLNLIYAHIVSPVDGRIGLRLVDPGNYVYLIGADDTVSARTVELGPLDGAMFAVNAGLSPGDRVVVDGADRLRDGAKVLVSGAKGSSNGGAAARPPDAVAPSEKRLPS